jgi:long-chain acyl-CoA synthetase
MSHRSTYELLREVCSTRSDSVGFRHKRDGEWQALTWGEVWTLVNRVARGMLALDVAHGDRVCLLANSRLEWVLADLGIAACGGVTVGIYQSSLAEDCAYIVEHSDAEVVLVEDDSQREKILAVRDRLPRLRKIVAIEGGADPAQDVITWDDLLAGGDAVPQSSLDERAAKIGPEDLASLVYTSGTTGVPKGVMITHDNLVFTVGSAVQRLVMTPGFCTLLFLPLAHVFARLMVYCCIDRGVDVAFAEHITKVPENMREVRPHFIASVPRIYEKVYDKVISSAEQAGGLKRRIFEWAMDVGHRVSKLQQRGLPVPWLLGLRRAVAQRLVFDKVKQAFGGRLVYGISGAAPLNQVVAEFFHACGILVLEGIGMTENTSFSNVNHPDENKFGTVGKVGPGIEQRIADDGEVLYRGRNVMKGYFKNPEATAETVVDGWLHTGDIGEIDADGYLRITDRKKDLIVTAGGKNVAPQRIERILRTSHYIGQVVACGDRRKFISALITLDPEHITSWAREQGKGARTAEELAEDPDVYRLIEAEVERLNTQLASFESVKKFAILPRDLTIESGELTPTLKVRRKVVFERYKDRVDALYA